MNFLRLRSIQYTDDNPQFVMVHPAHVISIGVESAPIRPVKHASRVILATGVGYEVPYSLEDISKCLREAVGDNSYRGFADADEFLGHASK